MANTALIPEEPRKPRATARVGWNNRVQTVNIPLGFRFPEGVHEVYIRREGDSVILTPKPGDWSEFFASGLCASDDFMREREALPVQERDFR